MPDKRISQLTERLTLAGTDVFPVVYVGAPETQKAKASTFFTYIKNTLISGIVQATTDTDKFLCQDGTEIKYRTGSELITDILPTQTGNNGKVLKTDGTTISWQPEAGATGVQSVTGTTVDNTDPQNPIVNVPTLQQVTDAGLQTNDSIKLENGFDIYDAANAQWIEARGGDGFVALKIAGALQDFFVAEIGLIAIKDGINKTGIINVGNIPASTTKNFALPNISGSSATLVTSVNGNLAGANGDVSISIPAAQDLQSVTGVGNTTTNDIIIQSGATPAISLQEISPTPGIPDGRITLINQNSQIKIDGSEIEYNTSTAGQTSIGFNQTSGTNSINFPTGNGTVVLSVNGTSPSPSGDVTISTGASLDLQGVTNNGNTTSSEIYVGIDGVGVYDPFAVDYLMLYSSSTNFNARLLGSANTIFEAGINQLKFGETIKAIFDNSILSASRTYNLPNANGTLVLSVNGTSPNASGDVTIAVGGSQTLQQTTDLGNTTTNDIVLQDSSLTGIDTLEFDLTPATTAHAEGRVRWNDSDKTLQIDTEDSSVSVSVGHDLIQRVVNNTGSTLNRGQVVYINGQQGGRPTVALADNISDPTSATTLGVIMSLSIGNNQNGYVITNGLLSGINTSSYSAGQQLYLGSSGALTGTKPTQPLHIVYVAKVVTVGLLGSIFVTVQNGQEIEELHDVLITSPTNGQVLTYETSSGLWKNQNVPAELPTQSGQTGKFLQTNGTSALWNFPTRHYKLGFNNISDYVVNGFSGVQNMGSGTLGLTYTTDLQSMLYAISGSNYIVNLKVITYEQYGGISNQIGVAVTYSSPNGSFTTNQTASGLWIGNFGTNFAIQTANLIISIPIQYNGANTQYFRFDVIMQRNSGGSTSVYGAELIFNT